MDIAEYRAAFLIGRVVLAWSQVEVSIYSAIGHARMSEAVNAGQWWEKTEKDRFRSVLNEFIRGHLPHPPYTKTEPNELREEVMELYSRRNNVAHNSAQFFPVKTGSDWP
jgi:hypothetical protein